VKSLQSALYKTAGIRGVPAGIGGGTVAAYLRRKGFDAAVWATLEETAHMPNEYCRIKNMVLDSKVMATLMLHPYTG
jgi:succinyl-diaminopimelate desuccinylase